MRSNQKRAEEPSELANPSHPRTRAQRRYSDEDRYIALAAVTLYIAPK